jgi:hypothetical protein
VRRGRLLRVRIGPRASMLCEAGAKSPDPGGRREKIS